ncbi:thioesterase II family protein [Streptomyces sp. NPDC050538]|uniref:thioesterase II family protein n=1 Tax=Streptomyces sp. NPDC050538 TaxID=3365627 RepID=UPI0037928B34
MSGGPAVSDGLARRWLPHGIAGHDETPLYLLPPAGGSAALYGEDDWAGLPAGVSACPVELPGHGRRATTDAPLTDMNLLVRQLDAVCRPGAGRPWAVLGHSMGALTAAAWAAHAHRAGHGPSAVYVSGAAPPWLSPVALRLARATDAELWEQLSGLGGMPPDLAVHPVARRLLVRTMRADIEAAASWARTDPVSVGCPVTAIGGTDDPAVPLSLLPGWSRISVGGFTWTHLPGGHFFRGSLADLVPVVSDAWRTP